MTLMPRQVIQYTQQRAIWLYLHCVSEKSIPDIFSLELEQVLSDFL